MEFEVFHAKPDKVKFGFEPRPVWPTDYDRVAVVHCESVEEVFRDTNHIDHAWQENDSIHWCRSKDKERSTSVDDVIIIHPPGVAYRCEMMGWEELGSVDEEELSMGKCGRCRKGTNMTTCSFFNTEMICPACEEKEMAHPDYKKAKEAEAEAVRSGNYNFPGIGKPSDL